MWRYGFAANLAARVSGLAPPGAVVVSDAVEVLIRNNFELEARPGLVNAQYNYTPAIHFAVREGHVAVATYLMDRGAETVDYRSYPFQDSLLTIAEDREDWRMADLLRKAALRRCSPTCTVS